jgi:hypothetical protein
MVLVMIWMLLITPAIATRGTAVTTIPTAMKNLILAVKARITVPRRMTRMDMKIQMRWLRLESSTRAVIITEWVGHVAEEASPNIP